jgi:hypothetical protein
MKMNKTNYFNSTYSKWECVEYKLNNVPDFISYKKDSWASEIEGKPIYTKKISSQYWYTDIGVFRKSDHWGVVGSCVWLIDDDSDVGFCKWGNFNKLEYANECYYDNSQIIKRKGFIYDIPFDKISFVVDEYNHGYYKEPETQIISNSVNFL